MDVLETHIDTSSEEFRANQERMAQLVAGLRQCLAEVLRRVFGRQLAVGCGQCRGRLARGSLAAGHE
jgi:hypothetical protein